MGHAPSAANASAGIEKNLILLSLAFRIMTPCTPQITALQKHHSPYTWAIMEGTAGDVEDIGL